MTASSEALQRVSCIRYPIQFLNNKVQALINFSSKVNVMTLAYVAKLGLTTWKTSVRVQKIDGLPLETYSMASASFSLQDSWRRVWFFEETFLLADTNMEVVLGMPFLSLNNANVKFAKLEKLIWSFYTAAEALLFTSWVEFFNKKEFTKIALDRNFETFVIHAAVLEVPTAMPIHPFRAF